MVLLLAIYRSLLIGDINFNLSNIHYVVNALLSQRIIIITRLEKTDSV